MIFTYKKWENFCLRLQQMGLQSIPAREVKGISGGYLVLKHDVETNVGSAYRMAQIEEKYGHRGSYYVQAYLLENSENVVLLQKMQKMGHEISYHYDVMDSCKGDLPAAMEEFEKNRRWFEESGFPVTTVCQHGNPVVERVGYTSNRDFFRSAEVCNQYPDIADIMVNYPAAYETEYLYFSDAGRIFKRIYDPINNDVIDCEEKNIPYEDLTALQKALDQEKGNIISIHPHRWTASAIKYVIKNSIFKTAKFVAKILMRIPCFKKLMSKYYYLAKKI
ncbi:MAG: hypothetical protein E7453_07860 [Ruminococcaceae bacterium]|nr:hypothetical protein [Oscillospiraceae bacterium]